MAKRNDRKEIAHDVASLRLHYSTCKKALNDLKKDGLTEYRRNLLTGVALSEYEKVKRLECVLQEHKTQGRLGDYDVLVRCDTAPSL